MFNMACQNQVPSRIKVSNKLFHAHDIICEGISLCVCDILDEAFISELSPKVGVCVSYLEIYR